MCTVEILENSEKNINKKLKRQTSSEVRGFSEGQGRPRGGCLFPGEERCPLLRTSGVLTHKANFRLRSTQNDDRNGNTQRAMSRHLGGWRGSGTLGAVCQCGLKALQK